MEIYQKAYECYRSACKNYGIESMNFYQFVKNLTKDQLHAYMKHAIN